MGWQDDVNDKLLTDGQFGDKLIDFWLVNGVLSGAEPANAPEAAFYIAAGATGDSLMALRESYWGTIYTAGGTETFRILAEHGGVILTEGNDFLRIETGTSGVASFGILAESGDVLITESGSIIRVETTPSAVSYGVLTEASDVLITESGSIIRTE